ncbi:uncharacterized protein ISCGN_016056 [Ixodes scapularis]
MKKTQPNSEDNICLAMSGLNKSLSRKKLTSSSSSLVLKYRTKAQVLDSAPDETSPKPRVVPHNKKMEEQPRCFPTKKKRPGSGPMHGKPPTSLEQQHIMEGLVARCLDLETGDLGDVSKATGPQDACSGLRTQEVCRLPQAGTIVGIV